MKTDDRFSFLADVEKLLNDKLGYPTGTEALRKICLRHAGEKIEIPAKTIGYRDYRSAQIRQTYTGKNKSELAIQWNISVKTVTSIINNQ